MSRKQLKRTLLMGGRLRRVSAGGHCIFAAVQRWALGKGNGFGRTCLFCKEHPHAGGGHAGRALCRIYRGGYLPESPQGPFHTKESSSELHPPGAALPRCVRNIRPFGPFRLLDMPCARHCLPISSLCPVWAVRAVF